MAIGKLKGYNRNLYGDKRPHKGISKLPEICVTNLVERLKYESKMLEKYLKRLSYDTRRKRI